MSKPMPLVRQLQADAIDSRVPVAKLLRVAKLIATKLDQKDALRWIDRELDGYMDGLTKDVPPYRMIGGQPKGFNPYRGWQTIQFEDAATAEKFSTVPLGQAIGSLEMELQRKRESGQSLVFAYPTEMANIIRKAIHFPTEVAVFLSEGSVWGVVETVRNLVLNWSLELEKAGILGEEMAFSPREQEEGRSVTQTFFIQNAGVVGNVSDKASVENTQTATVSLDVAAIAEFATRALAATGHLPAELKARLQPILTEIGKESGGARPDQGKLREMLKSARAIAEDAAGHLTASGIIAAIGKLLGA